MKVYGVRVTTRYGDTKAYKFRTDKARVEYTRALLDDFVVHDIETIALFEEGK